MSSQPTRIHAFDNLRTLAVLLVVLEHSLLAYQNFYPFYAHNFLFNIHPVRDEIWNGATAWVGFVFRLHVTLLFFLSGLFAYPSLDRYGVRGFWRRRWNRLGWPMVVGILVLVPLFYLPALWRIVPEGLNIAGYGRFWVYLAAHKFGNLGPFWFLYALLVFDVLAGLIYALDLKKRILPTAITDSLPNKLFFLLGLTLGVSYLQSQTFVVPLGLMQVEASKFLQYLGYFGLGVWLGFERYRYGRSVFLRVLSRRVWFIVGGVFLLTVFPVPRAWLTLSLVLASVGLGLRYLEKPVAWLEFLNRHSFTIYYFHYLFVVYVHYVLLAVSWSPAWKVVVTAGVSLSAALFVSLILSKTKSLPSLLSRRLH